MKLGYKIVRFKDIHLISSTKLEYKITRLKDIHVIPSN